MRKASSITQQDLPQYLGFGTLDSASVSTKAGKTTANYMLGNEVVYQVTIGKKNCEIVEFLEGQELGRSAGATLQDAFLHHMMSIPPYRNRRFERLYHQITDNRNISVRFASQPQAIYFPAGYIFLLRQPIVASNLVKWKTLKTKLEHKSDTAPVQFDGEHPAVIFRLLRSGKVNAEKVTVADFSTILLNLASAADMLWQSGIVPGEKEYRLAVIDGSESSSGNMLISLGEPERDVITFSVFVTEGIKVDMKKATKLFFDSSQQFLASLR